MRVLDVAKLAAGDIAFMSNSWRGDRFEPQLRNAVTASGESEKEAMVSAILQLENRDDSD